jgi:predicted AAA+ superfamily ATPase
MIERHFYLQKIQNFLDSKVVKVLVWQRRVWKSYILKQVIQKLSEQIPLKNFFI